jgi:1-deoxy-D-xylulose-5-phosphate reductoisomerase
MDYPELTFEQPDTDTFRNLALAFKALEKAGNMPCILNAANEVVVSAFLEEKISFLGMSEVIANCLDKMSFIKKPSLQDYIETDKETRIKALEFIR